MKTKFHNSRWLTGTFSRCFLSRKTIPEKMPFLENTGSRAVWPAVLFKNTGYVGDSWVTLTKKCTGIELSAANSCLLSYLKKQACHVAFYFKHRTTKFPSLGFRGSEPLREGGRGAPRNLRQTHGRRLPPVPRERHSHSGQRCSPGQSGGRRSHPGGGRRS